VWLELVVVEAVVDPGDPAVQVAVVELEQEHLLVNQVLQVLLQVIQAVAVVAEECPVDQVEMVVVEL
jgi:hypothetical protein